MLREIWPFVESCARREVPVVLARLVGREGTGSRPLGSTMAVAADGTWRGSVSGGCVEGMVVDAARAVLDGAAPHVLSVHVGGELLPWEDTPVCGGELRVLITPVPPAHVVAGIGHALVRNRPLAVGVDLRAPYAWSYAPTVDELADSDSVFVDVPAPRKRLVLVGATDLAAALARFAEPLDRAVVVLDPRPGHVESGAIPGSATVFRGWPDAWITEHRLAPEDALVVLSHDPRIDDPALRAALAGDAGYVAALGSRPTHAQRLRRLHGTPGLDRLIGPVGLDLGGASIAETSLSILAELVAVENARDGGRLCEGAGTLVSGRIRGQVG